MQFAGSKKWIIVGAFLAFAPLFTNAQSLPIGGDWSNLPVATQTGNFSVEFDATPSNHPMDGVIGFSDGSAGTFSDLGTIVRFAPTGLIDARNAGAYTAAAQIPYAANTAYHFRLDVDVTAHTYSVFVTAPGGAEQTVASGYAFRSEQSGVTQLNNLGGMSSGGSVLVDNINLGGGNLPPTVQIVNPASGTTFTSPATIVINATAGDADGNVARVDFYNGATLLGSDASSPYSYTINGVAPGSLQLTARAVDNGGSTKTSEAVSVTVESPYAGQKTLLQLVWDPSLSTNVVAYRMHCGTSPGQYDRHVDAGASLSCVITNLEVGVTYYFAATAIDRNGVESDYSNAVSATAPLPGPALNVVFLSDAVELRVQGTPLRIYLVDESENLRDWTTVATTAADPLGLLNYTPDRTGPHRFYRVREL